MLFLLETAGLGPFDPIARGCAGGGGAGAILPASASRSVALFLRRIGRPVKEGCFTGSTPIVESPKARPYRQAVLYPNTLAGS